jgi:LytS/YehU family sensor histidine kinase
LKPNPSSKNTGVGLKNLQKRLFFNFQDNASFLVEEENNRVIASIKIVNAN